MTNLEIADVLRDYWRAKREMKELRSEMIEIAVNLGVDQAEAKDMDVQRFLDGYLVGQGMMQSWRNIGS